MKTPRTNSKAHRHARAIVKAEITDAIEWSGKTQKEIAKRAGFSESHLSLLVNGERVPSIEAFADIMVACGRKLTRPLSA